MPREKCKMKSDVCDAHGADFRITPVKSGFNTVRLEVQMNMFGHKPRATLGLIVFTVLIQKSEKQWKVFSGGLKNLPSRIPSGRQTFPQGCALGKV